VKSAVSYEKVTYQKKRKRENKNLICKSPVNDKKIFDKEEVIEYNPKNKREKKARGAHNCKDHKTEKRNKKFSWPEKRNKIAIECDKKKKPPRQNKPGNGEKRGFQN
jgi:hypothetical protein